MFLAVNQGRYFQLAFYNMPLYLKIEITVARIAMSGSRHKARLGNVAGRNHGDKNQPDE